MENDPSKELALEMFKFLLPKAEVDTTIILLALSMVLATVAVEAGMPEEKAGSMPFVSLMAMPSVG